ncbi:hypothetical protein TorRG33x02_310620 [Trema orientale]|uniref:Uncharacterized protein n=1 Tax=Trema orientale TaxID=63057 RepID=A0A2P5BSF6_TREOI|nr:hypothetical protein TorRG33x02_310620 [Trema orientale]
MPTLKVSKASSAHNWKHPSLGKVKLNMDASVHIAEGWVDEVECDALRAIQGLAGSTCFANNALLVQDI